MPEQYRPVWNPQTGRWDVVPVGPPAEIPGVPTGPPPGLGPRPEQIVPSETVLDRPPLRTKARYKDFFVYSAHYEPLTASASRTQRTVRIDGGSDFEVYKIVAVATDNRIGIRIADGSSGRFFSNAEIRLANFAGTGQFPFILPARRLWRGGSEIIVEATEYSAANNNFYLAFVGAKVFPYPVFDPERYKHWEFFDYVASLSLGASASAIGSIGIDADADFEVVKMCILRDAGATLDIEASGPNRRFMDRAQHVDNLGATAEAAAIYSAMVPFILPIPKFVSRASAVQLIGSDLSGAANTVRIALRGIKYYPA